jgi:hypothetical protein
VPILSSLHPANSHYGGVCELAAQDVAPRPEMESTGRERHEEEEEKPWIEAHQQRNERGKVTIIQMQGHPFQIWLKSNTILICTGSLDTCESNKSRRCCCCAKAQRLKTRKVVNSN